MASFVAILDERIQARAKLNLKRELRPACGIDFTSNDYLGFSTDPELRACFDLARLGLPLSGAGSRLLRGELPVYQEVEKVCAEFSKQEAALLYPSGYQANVGLFSAILTSKDQIFSDELNHASIIDGIRLGHAPKVIYPHRDLRALEKALDQSPSPKGMRVIVTESIFSMDGSFAKLAELVQLAERFDVALIVDEAHATGLYRSGRVEHEGLSNEVLATIHTGGKALGASGAWIAGSAKLREYLIQYSRAFIYSTAPFPEQALLLKLAIEHWKGVGQIRVNFLFENLRFFRDSLQKLSPLVPIPENISPIFPVMIGNTEKTLRIAEQLQAHGFDVRAIRPPTVAEGSSRLRIILHSHQTRIELLSLAKALHSLLGTECTQ